MPAKLHPPSRVWPAPTEPFDVHRKLLGWIFLNHNGKMGNMLRLIRICKSLPADNVFKDESSCGNNGNPEGS